MGKKMVKCKTCGAEIAKSAKTCPQCGAKRKRPVLGTVIAIFGILLFISGITGALSGNDEPKKVGEATPAPTSVQSEAPKNTFAVGEEVELDDIVVTLNSVTESVGSQYNKPSDGNVFVLCEFTIENDSNRDIAVSSLVSFSAYVDDFATNISLSALIEKGNKQQLDGSVVAGKKMAGVVGYEVPEDWSELEIRFTPGFWSGKDITFAASNSND